MRRLLGTLCAALLAVACSSTPASSATPAATVTPTISQSALLIYTKWMPDPKSVSGPEPGYKPAFTGLTGLDVQSATPAIDSMGVAWVVIVKFTPRGRDLFKQLTRENVAACGDPNAACPQRHLTIWLDLVQKDLDNWDDPAYAAKVSQPYDLKCLAQAVAEAVCPKLVIDPITLNEIDGGSMAIAANLTQQTANELANVINAGKARAAQ